jgi:hypothetical protein
MRSVAFWVGTVPDQFLCSSELSWSLFFLVDFDLNEVMLKINVANMMCRELSGAHIEVEKQSKGQGDRTILIKGNQCARCKIKINN